MPALDTRSYALGMLAFGTFDNAFESDWTRATIFGAAMVFVWFWYAMPLHFESGMLKLGAPAPSQEETNR